MAFDKIVSEIMYIFVTNLLQVSYLRYFKIPPHETPGGSVVECLPLAQVVIPGSWDRVSHQAPCRSSASLSVSLMNK